MTPEPSFLLTTSFYLGSMICILLAFHDFIRNVPPYQKNRFRIAILGTLFVIVVFSVYLGLLYIMVGLFPTTESPYVAIGGINKEFENFRLIAPILLSVMYFGSSKTCLRIAGKDICLYYRLLQVFIGFLTTPLNQEEVSRVIQQNQVESLQSFLNNSINKSNDLSIHIPSGNFDLESIKKELHQAEDGVAFLEDIKSRKETIDIALSRIKQNIDKIRKGYLEKLKTAVSSLVEMNTSNALFADFTIRYFEILPSQKSKVAYPLIRALAMAIIGAIFFALIYQKTGTDYEISVRVFLISLSLFSFLLWFNWLDKCSLSIEGASLVIMLGIAAGASGSITFCLIDPKSGILWTWIEKNILGIDKQNVQLTILNILLSIEGLKLIKGIIMGTAASLIVYFFRFLIVKRIRNIVNVFFLLIIAGFIVFSLGELLWLIMSNKNLLEKNLWGDVWPIGAAGTILSVVIAMVSAVLHNEAKALPHNRNA